MAIPEIGAAVMLKLPNQPGWNRAESRVLRIDIGPVNLWAGTDQTHLTYHTPYGPVGLVGRRFYCALTVGTTVGLTWVHARPVTVFRRRPDGADRVSLWDMPLMRPVFRGIAYSRQWAAQNQEGDIP